MSFDYRKQPAKYIHAIVEQHRSCRPDESLMVKSSGMAVRLILFCVVAVKCFVDSSSTFHVRHHMGKCLELRADKLVYSSICRDHFRWKGGAKLIHVPTDKCLVPGGVIGGNSIPSSRGVLLTNNCSGTDAIFQYKEKYHKIKHLMTGLCLTPGDGIGNDPPDNAGLVLSSSCSVTKAKYWLVPQVLYVVRHFGGMCWKYNKAQSVIELMNTYVCDRFMQQNGKHLQHFATGKCVIPSGGYLRLTSDCSHPETNFDLDGNSIMRQTTSNKCVSTGHNTVSQPAGADLQLMSHCQNADANKMRFFEEKNIFKISLISESCNDGSYGTNCALRKGHININGYQYSPNIRGINIAVFDYRSGILEQKSGFDVFNSNSARNALVLFLNNLPSGKLLFMSMKDALPSSFGTSLDSALQQRGVPISFASSNRPKQRCSMATIAFTGPNRKAWEESVVQPGCNGPSKIEKTIYAFRDFKGIDDCSEELGLRTGKIRDEQFSAESFSGSDSKAFYARLHMNIRGWCAATDSLNHHLQIDLGGTRMLTGIALQAHGTWYGRHYLTKFSLQYSLDGSNWLDYLDEAKNKMVFTGLGRAIVGETKVNWFSRTLARHVRVVSVERDPNYPDAFCIRMELFGCSASGLSFAETNKKDKDRYIMQQYSNKVSFFGIPPLDRNIQVRFSAAASNTTLGEEIDQYNIAGIVTKVVRNSSVVAGAGKVYRMQHPTSGTTSAFRFTCSFDSGVYNEVEIEIKNKIIDAGKDSGLQTWNIYSYEGNESIRIIGSDLAIKRESSDKSMLAYSIIKSPKMEYENGGEFNFSLSIKHPDGKSFANAYQLQLAVYYDTNYLTLTSFSNVEKEKFMMPPTRNSSTPGVVSFHTDELGLLTNHFIDFKFKFNFPSQIFKGNNCEGAVITEFSYKNNLVKYGGRINNTLDKDIPYKCRFPGRRSLMTTTSRITVPGFSILFDDVNSNLYVCKRRTEYWERNLPFCFVHDVSKSTWRGIPNMASVVGVDTSQKVLFGIDRNGHGYVSLSDNLKTILHVDDDEWTSIQSQPHVRKAKTAIDVKSLPIAPDASWMFPASGTQIWAATNTKVLKKITGQWTGFFHL